MQTIVCLTSNVSLMFVIASKKSVTLSQDTKSRRILCLIQSQQNWLKNRDIFARLTVPNANLPNLTPLVGATVTTCTNVVA